MIDAIYNTAVEIPRWLWFLFGLTGGYLVCMADLVRMTKRQEMVIVKKDRRRW